jgi:2-methylcitrate dehydratase PrpD
MTEALGERYEIERISVKLYACCKLFHSLIEAIAACREDYAFKPEDVLAIEPFGPSHMIDSHMEYRPKSMMAAQYSLPFVCAVAIMMDPAMPASFSDQAMADSAVLRMTDRVKPVVDKALEAMFPRRFPGGVRIKLRGGAVLSRTVLDSRSSPDLPIGRSEIQEKFVAVTQGLMSPKRQNRVMEMVTQLDRVAHVGELAALLR